ncbi:MAG: hypothetical protein EBR30_27275 [Cytophagia bacterium]|nr:hypothetical protein [Cytophagia bacterium]
MSLDAFTQSSWEVAKNEDGIVVYTRAEKGDIPDGTARLHASEKRYYEDAESGWIPFIKATGWQD